MKWTNLQQFFFLLWETRPYINSSYPLLELELLSWQWDKIMKEKEKKYIFIDQTINVNGGIKSNPMFFQNK